MNTVAPSAILEHFLTPHAMIDHCFSPYVILRNSMTTSSNSRFEPLIKWMTTHVMLRHCVTHHVLLEKGLISDMILEHWLTIYCAMTPYVILEHSFKTCTDSSCPLSLHNSWFSIRTLDKERAVTRTSIVMVPTTAVTSEATLPSHLGQDWAEY